MERRGDGFPPPAPLLKGKGNQTPRPMHHVPRPSRGTASAPYCQEWQRGRGVSFAPSVLPRPGGYGSMLCRKGSSPRASDVVRVNVLIFQGAGIAQALRIGGYSCPAPYVSAIARLSRFPPASRCPVRFRMERLPLKLALLAAPLLRSRAACGSLSVFQGTTPAPPLGGGGGEGRQAPAP